METISIKSFQKYLTVAKSLRTIVEIPFPENINRADVIMFKLIASKRLLKKKADYHEFGYLAASWLELACDLLLEGKSSEADEAIKLASLVEVE